MKVVLFCGGYGLRMRNDHNDVIPKPMQMVGPRPLLWHVMHYYAHFGHTEFILCLGYGAEAIKDYFLDYREAESNDFVLRASKIELLNSDISDWSITFVDTGLESAIGERLRRVRQHLGEDEYFLANYADVLTDAPLDDVITKFHESGRGCIHARRHAPVLVPLRQRGRERRGQGDHPGQPAAHLGERRIFRPQSGDLRSPSPWRRSRGRCV